MSNNRVAESEDEKKDFLEKGKRSDELETRIETHRRGKRWICGCILLHGVTLIAALLLTCLVFALLPPDDIIDRDTYFTPRNLCLPVFDDANHEAVNVEALAEAVRHRTVSYSDSRDKDLDAKRGFLEFLRRKFPRLHDASRIELTKIGEVSIMFEIRGSNETLKPYLLIAHTDVVPADAMDGWEFDPFEGKVTEDFVYGRGTLDMKASLIAIASTLEKKLNSSSWKPQRTILFFCGHDEEIGGWEGAGAASDLLRKRGTRLEFILDEGFSVTKNFFKGLDQDVALVGVSEKGFLSVEIEAMSEAGHSSIPPAKMAIPNLAEALLALRDNPLPFHFDPDDLNRKTIDILAPYFSFVQKFVLRNSWLFGWITKIFMQRSPVTSALARTTTAFTMISGGVKDNVLPKSAKALVNHRIHPRDNMSLVLEWDQRVLQDFDVTVHLPNTTWANEPAPVAPYGANDAAYHVIKGAIHAVFGNVLVAPALTVGGTDSKHFVDLSECGAYRFAPFVLDKSMKDSKRFHGVNERLDKNVFVKMIRFYEAVIILADQI